MADKLASESGHWYTKTGEPAYTVIGKNGIERATTLRDARPAGLLPSVTTVLKVLDNPAIANWRIRNAVLACRTIPNLESIPDDELIATVTADAFKEGRDAADVGTYIHGQLERYISGQPYDETYKKHVMSATRAVTEWAGVQKWNPEKSFAHPLGFGGKCDLSSKTDEDEGFVIDFKTIDGDKIPKYPYDSYIYQLAAYREGLGIGLARCAICYVSRTVAGLVKVVEVDETDLINGWYIFESAIDIWQRQRNYWPGEIRQ